MNENHKVLIVGGAGYIGGYLVDLLDKFHYNVTVFDNLLYESRYLKRVNFVRGDIRNEAQLQPWLDWADTVIWLAAIVGDGACAVNKEITWDVNHKAVLSFIKNFKKQIVFTSTCSVYGMNDAVLNEDSPTNPLSVYAETKLAAEQAILANCKEPLVFRLGTLYGVGDAFSRIRLDLVGNVLSYKATIGEQLNVFGGEQWRPLLHVKDVARGILYGFSHHISGLYNLGDGNYKITDIAETVKKVIPGTVVNYQPIPFEDKRNYKVNCSAYKAHGWRPTYKLEEGIEEVSSIIREGRIVDPTNPIYSNAHYLKLEHENRKYT